MLSKPAYKLLQEFNKKSFSNEDLKHIDIVAFEHLKSNGYVTRDSLGYPDGFHAKYSDYHITEAGKGYLHEYSRTEWFKNNWIALLSLLFAFIAALPVIIQAIYYILKYIA